MKSECWEQGWSEGVGGRCDTEGGHLFCQKKEGIPTVSQWSAKLLQCHRVRSSAKANTINSDNCCTLSDDDFVLSNAMTCSTVWHVGSLFKR